MNYDENMLEDIKAVIFDMDGVLIDSEPLWKIAMEEVFAETGIQITRKEFQKTVGLRIDEVVVYWLEAKGIKNQSAPHIEAMIVHRMVELIKEKGEPLPGVVESIKILKSKGYKIGLGTSSYRILIDTVLEVLNLTDQFDYTHTAEDEDFGKPHPAVYLTVAENLDVHPTKCLVIEDSLTGIISAKAARMKVLCIPEKTHHPEPKLVVADYHMTEMTELVTLLEV